MRWVSIAVLCALSACVRSQEVTCSDGRICAPGDTCDDVNHRCISPTQIGACADHAEGDACTLAGAPGTCHAGACEPLICGDGQRTGTELCDGSDLGTADCTSAGFYEPAGLACTAFCTFDTSQCTGTCGDGIINGGELCDGAPPLATCIDQGFDAGSLACGTSCGASFEACGAFGFRPEQTGVVFLSGIAGTSRADLWVVGANGSQGVASHFDGAAWTLATANATHGLFAVSEAVAGDVWALALPSSPEPDLVLHLVAGQWTVVADAPAATYKDVFALDATNVYVATTDAGLLHWNGSTWAALGTLAAPLVAVRGTGTSDVWAAQSDGTLQHWTGASWTPATLAATIRRIDAVAPDDVWVIGTSTVTAGAGAVAHWDGAVWTLYVDGNTAQFTAVAARAPNDVWVAQSLGSARHFDGINWTWSSGPLTVASSGITGLVKLPGGELASASFNGFAYRFGGQAYAHLDMSSAVISAAIWSDTPDDTYVASRTGTVVHFDGVRWTPTTVDPSGKALKAVWGSGPSNVWVAGGSGHAFQFDGGGWTDRFTSTFPIAAIGGTGPTDVWLLDAVVTHYDGASFTPALSPAGTQFVAISTMGANDVWIVGQVATGTDVYHWDGTAWASTHVADTLNSIAEVAPDDVFATTSGSHVVHFDGTAWTDTALPALDPLIRVAATAHDDVFAASSTELFHFDGARWTPVRMPNDAAVGGLVLGDLAASPGHVDLLFPNTFGSQQVRRLIRTRPWNCRATETDCHDGVDDDCDGAVDGLDSDCP